MSSCVFVRRRDRVRRADTVYIHGNEKRAAKTAPSSPLAKTGSRFVIAAWIIFCTTAREIRSPTSLIPVVERSRQVSSRDTGRASYSPFIHFFPAHFVFFSFGQPTASSHPPSPLDSLSLSALSIATAFFFFFFPSSSSFSWLLNLARHRELVAGNLAISYVLCPSFRPFLLFAPSRFLFSARGLSTGPCTHFPAHFSRASRPPLSSRCFRSIRDTVNTRTRYRYVEESVGPTPPDCRSQRVTEREQSERA